MPYPWLIVESFHDYCILGRFAVSTKFYVDPMTSSCPECLFALAGETTKGDPGLLPPAPAKLI